MHRDRGFTLIEVLLALTLGALVVLLAHRIFTGVLDGVRRVAEARVGLDREQNARRWLMEAFGSLEVGDRAGPFAGHPDRVEFGSWRLTPEGWLSRQRLTLGEGGSRLVARFASGDSLVLVDSVAEVKVDYLLELGERATWVREWISPVSAPLAIRLRIARAGSGEAGAGVVDTLLLIVGPRG
jgi:prepilin-type N-terminal cleavage/methylation domain-containing protein